MANQMEIIYTEELDTGWSFETTDGIIVVGIGKRENDPLLESVL